MRRPRFLCVLLGHVPGRPYAINGVRVAECERCHAVLAQPSLDTRGEYAPALQSVIDGSTATTARLLTTSERETVTVASKRAEIKARALARNEAARGGAA